ncbi:MAG: sortase [Dehalococcoidia bacterium]|nr:sortase [Dehalococcoidia bacterium]
MANVSKKRALPARVGMGLVITGGLLMLVVGGYYGLAAYAYTQLTGLSATSAPDAVERGLPEGWQTVEVSRLPGDSASETPKAGALAKDGKSALDGPAVDLYPAGVAAATASLVPSAEAARANAPARQAGGLRPVKLDDLPRTVGETPPARRIQIPSIGVDSKVVELNTVWNNGILEWETPKWAVGHHNGTANPGERNNMVLSGHISSPLLREGEVFKRLPEIPKLLDSGQIVDIIVFTDDTRFLYRVVRWELVKPEQLDVFARTEEPVVTLITCYPDYAYWDRLIITGRLVAMAPL